jgi:predicted HTH domain antitoxin
MDPLALGAEAALLVSGLACYGGWDSMADLCYIETVNARREYMSVVLEINMPETVFSAIRKSPSEFAAEMRLAAAVKWYEMGMVSQEKAAEVAGLSRTDFIFSLARFEVSPFQYTAEEMENDLRDAD